jgi:hypothetical protein
MLEAKLSVKSSAANCLYFHVEQGRICWAVVLEEQGWRREHVSVFTVTVPLGESRSVTGSTGGGSGFGSGRISG